MSKCRRRLPSVGRSTCWKANCGAPGPAGWSQTNCSKRDETAVPFITIDPPTSKDLDQAMAIDRDGAGYRVRYAIADVPAFVRAGGAVDAEARRRGQTVYCPDERVQLHPSELSEGAASLLPAAFSLAERVLGMSLPRAVRTITLNPARAAGLDDRGAIEPHLRADFVQVRLKDGIPAVRRVWREGLRVM